MAGRSRHTSPPHLGKENFPPLSPQGQPSLVENSLHCLQPQAIGSSAISPLPQNSSPRPQPHANIYANVLTLQQSTKQLKPIGVKDGSPSVGFTREDKARLKANQKHTLIAKFSHGRPTYARMRQVIHEMKFEGEVRLFAWDAKHVFLEFDSHADYMKMWRRSSYQIDKFNMRLLKWTPSFSPMVESPITPVWITLPNIPEIMYDEQALISIGNSIGEPLKAEMPLCNRARFNECRVLVEIDVSESHPDKVWISFGVNDQGVEDGYWQKIVYGDMQHYCKKCMHLGHSDERCKMGQKSKPDAKVVSIYKKLQTDLRDTLVDANTEVKEADKKVGSYAKEALWNGLRGIKDSQHPWMVMGDFNDISSINEQIGCIGVDGNAMDAFNSMIMDCDLEDGGYSGSKFTWSCGKKWKRLDRVLLNACWNDNFMFTKIEHLLEWECYPPGITVLKINYGVIDPPIT